jgi:hypothetical protein
MEHRLRTGHLAALLGAIVTAASLWLPWYEIRLGELARGALGAQARQLPGGLGEFARGLASILPESISGTGWEVLQGADAALIAGAVLVGALVLAAGGALGAGVRVDGAAAGPIVGVIGLVGSAIVVQHALSRPGPDELVSLRGGIWVALAGTLLTAFAGFSISAPARPGPASVAPAALAFTTPIDDHGALEPVRPSVAPPPATP